MLRLVVKKKIIGVYFNRQEIEFSPPVASGKNKANVFIESDDNLIKE